MLDEAFEGRFSDHDWDHALGGLHAIVWEGTELVGHASVVQRRLMHAGRAWRAGYVEAVGVRPEHGGRGHATAMMDALEGVIRRAYDVGALSASAGATSFYLHRSWQPWTGHTFVLTDHGIRPTPEDDGSTYVFEPTAAFDLRGELVCDWRDGDVW